MPIYEERLQRDLKNIREGVLAVGEKVLLAYQNSVHAMLTNNRTLAHQVILGDEVINNALRKIDGLCHRFIAIHLPSGGHLRTISAIIRVNIELERIGDYAVTVSRESIQFDTPPPKEFAYEIERIAAISSRTLQMAMEAFQHNNADMATTTKNMAMLVETVFEHLLDRLVASCKQHPETTEDMFRLMHVFTKLIRVADQASNICNEILFAVIGSQRQPRMYQIWFIDEKNTLSKLAEEIARKLYPKSAEYSSFGSMPVEGYDPLLVNFLNEKGIPLKAGEHPRLFDLTPQELQNLNENQILVSLQGPLKQYVSPLNSLERIPFRIVILEWNVSPLPEGLEPAQVQQCYDERYREIAYKIQELIQTFKGEEAA